MTDTLPIPQARVLLESPLAGRDEMEVEQNMEFARNVCRGLCHEGFAPYASHLFFTQFLDDTIPEERAMGIGFGLEWGRSAHIVIFALPPGKEIEDSRGMSLALDYHRMNGKTLMLRRYNEDGTELISNEEI